MGSRKRGPKFRRVEVGTAEVLRLEVDDGRDVRGAYVRLAPRLRSSERRAFDAAGAVDSLRARGAAAAVFSPTTVPDAVGREEAPRGVDARAEAAAWFGPAPEGDAAEALAEVLRLIDGVGL